MKLVPDELYDEFMRFVETPQVVLEGLEDDSPIGCMTLVPIGAEYNDILPEETDTISFELFQYLTEAELLLKIDNISMNQFFAIPETDVEYDVYILNFKILYNAVN